MNNNNKKIITNNNSHNNLLYIGFEVLEITAAVIRILFRIIILKLNPSGKNRNVRPTLLNTSLRALLQKILSLYNVQNEHRPLLRKYNLKSISVFDIVPGTVIEF